MMEMFLRRWDVVHFSLTGKMKMGTINMNEGLIKVQ